MKPTQRSIVIVSGYWSTNIGNSFFQLGAEYLLKTVFPGDRIICFSDQPGYWNVAQGNPENAFVMLENMEFDYLVILGPFLRPEYDAIWLSTLRKLYARNVKIIVLAAGMMKYDPKTIQQCRDWLSETPPYIFSTRDSRTYELFQDIPEHSYDGIDVATYVSDLFAPIPMTVGDFVVYNFDKWPEPRVVPGANPDSVGDHNVPFRGQEWWLTFPKRRKSLVERSRLLQFFDTRLPQKYDTHFAGLPIVRTDHRTNPAYLRNMFRGPNAYASDVPYGYLNLYANTALTLSNRVHACVATLVYGNAAMLFSASPRSKLLDRLGVPEITKGPQTLDLEYLVDEKQKMESWLREKLAQ